MDPLISKNISRVASQSLKSELNSLSLARSFEVKNSNDFKEKLVASTENFELACILNNNYESPHNDLPFIAGLGAKSKISFEGFVDHIDLQEYLHKNSGEFIMCSIGYDYKNSVEDLHSLNTSYSSFPELVFFVPETLIIIRDNKVEIESSSSDEETVFEDILNTDFDFFGESVDKHLFSSLPNKNEYLDIISQLKEEIELGNIYEINFCRTMIAELKISPYSTAINLFRKNKAPFSCFFKYNDQFLLSSSPERFFQKSGDKITAQPMKGTVRRSMNDEEDKQLKNQLSQDIKERAENVMIVDLVRNDLSKTAVRGSVKVEELFSVYTFPKVHQMISTISSEIDEAFDVLDIFKTSFPMGSMTGAPKLRAMELIEKHEKFKRGIFSGSVGFISPLRNADFNVIIRSVVYDEKKYTVSIPTGSAITSLSDPMREWYECELKSEALFECLVPKI